MKIPGFVSPAITLIATVFLAGCMGSNPVREANIAKASSQAMALAEAKGGTQSVEFDPNKELMIVSVTKGEEKVCATFKVALDGTPTSTHEKCHPKATPTATSPAPAAAPPKATEPPAKKNMADLKKEEKAKKKAEAKKAKAADEANKRAQALAAKATPRAEAKVGEK